MIPAWLVSLITFLWGISWILFARIHKTPALFWFCLPIFGISAVYGYCSVVDMPVRIQAVTGQVGILAVAIMQTVVLMVFSFIERKRHEH